MSEFTSLYGYQAARELRGRRLILNGPTYQHRAWISAQGGSWDKAARQWSIPIPGANAKCADLLYGIVSRGMQYRTD